jgi:hypothetical protein
MTRKRSNKKNAKSAAGKKRKPARKPLKKKNQKRASARSKSGSGKTAGSTQKKKVRRSGRATARTRGSRGYPDTQAADLQGLSRRETADSESVDELLEEGNAFEAGVISGVEEADNSDQREVHTHEVPEDDVPEEYLDEQ